MHLNAARGYLLDMATKVTPVSKARGEKPADLDGRDSSQSRCNTIVDKSSGGIRSMRAVQEEKDEVLG